ncbi:MAG: WD40 domain-containing protein [Armatimonadota bacterium]
MKSQKTSMSNDSAPHLILTTGHSAAAVLTAFLPDDKMIVSAGYDRTLIVWDVETGEMLRVIQSASLDFGWESLSPDGIYAISRDWICIGKSKTVQSSIWNVQNSNCVQTFDEKSVSVSSNGLFFAISSTWEERDKILIVDGKTQKVIRRLECDTDSFYSNPVFSTDGRKLAVSTFGGIWIYDIYSGLREHVLEIPAAVLADEKIESPDILECAISSDGHLAAAVGFDRMWLWMSDSGDYIGTIRSGDTWFECVAFSPDSSTLAVGSHDRNITLYNTDTWEIAYNIKVHHGNVRSIAFSSSGDRMVTSGDDHLVKILDAGTGEILKSFGKLIYCVNSLAFTKDSRTLISGNDDGSIRFWDMQPVALQDTFSKSSWPVERILLINESNQLAGYARNPDDWYDAEVSVWNLDTHRLDDRITRHQFYLAYSPDEQFRAAKVTIKSECSQSDMHEIHIIHKGKVISILQVEQMKYRRNRWYNPDGSNKLDGIFSAAFSYDNTILAIGHEGFYVSLWDIQTSQLIDVIFTKNDSMGTLSFSPDDKTLAMGSQYNSDVMLFSVKTLKEKRRLTDHTDHVTSVAFSPDGKVLATGSADGTIKLWNPRNGKLLSTLVILPCVNNEEISTEWIAYSPDNSYTGSKNAEEFIRWEVHNIVYPYEKIREDVMYLNRFDRGYVIK